MAAMATAFSSCHYFGNKTIRVGTGRISTSVSTSNEWRCVVRQKQNKLAQNVGNRGVVTMAGTGTFFVGGNWKCNGTKDSISKLVSDLNSAKLEEDVDIVVAPPFVYIEQVKNSITVRIEIAAQNSWVGKGGAFTGEISVEQLKDIGCQWVILGHSERRHVIGENNQFIGKKAAYALSQGLKVIACIGEKLEEREAGKTFDVCYEQLKAFTEAMPSWDDVVIAYEPVWAIGTGKVATPDQAQEVHVAVREWLRKNVSSEVASKTRIIYGGSVNGSNCAELAKQEDIDGFLVGGASLKGAEFATICNSVTAKKVAA
uniref:TSA: Wollemia nobilis Ref_Wollemi_Transcript_11966_1281 transcribed RNA sequence n=1 Tax=Wollemia nobilis TaxID=56998 RepID=A0A0C9RUY0_9CONI